MNKFSVKFWILTLVLWQLFSVLLMAIGAWPVEVAWLNFGLSGLFIVLASPYHSLLFFIVSIPYFIAIPNPYFDSLSLWRPLAVLLFTVWVVKGIREKQNKLGYSLLQSVKFWVKGIRFAPWDCSFTWFASLALAVTLVFARFLSQGVQQFLFFLNAYLVYMVVLNTVREKWHLPEVVRSMVYSLLVAIAVGYLQLFVTFFASLDTFWVYWASFVSKLYYGQYFSSVALYSNSWFSYNGVRDLRMFGIMPDSQSFAYLCVFALGSLALFVPGAQKFRWWIWSGIVLSAFAIVFSGTRAVWVGVALPLVAVILSIAAGKTPRFGYRVLAMLGVFTLLFALGPVVKSGVVFLRSGILNQDVTDRIRSIYDLSETSNAGRVQIWKESLRYVVKHPQGVGLDNFLVSLVPDAQLGSYQELAGGLNERYNLPQEYVSAHSLYLQVLVELGVLGLVAFVVFLLSYFKTIWHFYKQYGSNQNFPVLLVVGSGIVVLWLLASAAFDITLLNDRVYIYFLLTLALSGSVVINYEKFTD